VIDQTSRETCIRVLRQTCRHTGGLSRRAYGPADDAGKIVGDPSWITTDRLRVDDAVAAGILPSCPTIVAYIDEIRAAPRHIAPLTSGFLRGALPRRVVAAPGRQKGCNSTAVGPI
jgi:hypothetical protein